MRVRTLVAGGVLLTGAALAVGPASPALAVCDSYSTGCPTPPAEGEGLADNDQDPARGGGPAGPLGSSGGPGSADGADSTGDPTTLPFTGGELVLMTAVGAGAVAGGTALVLAGRRRKSPAA